MGLYDDIDKEVLGQTGISTNNTTRQQEPKGLFDDIDNEVNVQTQVQQPTFAENHPFVASIPEAAKQFGTRAVKAYQELPQTLPTQHPVLYGSVQKFQGAMNDFGGAFNEPVQNPNVAQGIGNIVRDLGQFGTGLVQGIPQFLGDIKNQANTTVTNIQNSPEVKKAILPAVGHGFDKALGDIVSGALNLPESVAASYMGRKVNPHLKSTAPFEFYADKANEIMFHNGIISQKQYEDYLQHKLESQQQQSQVPIAETVGEFIPAMIPIGKAAGLFGGTGKAAQTAENISKLSKAQKIARTAKDIGKAGAVGAGYGFVVNPEASLAERSQAAGSGATAGTLLGSVGKAIQAGGRAAAPYVHNAAKNTAYAAGKGTRAILDAAGEIKDRLNPNNYETVLDAKPVEKGMGLSSRTVYEPELKTVFKKQNKTKNVNQNEGEISKKLIKETGTGFVLKESSGLKTPTKPIKVQKLLSDFGENIPEKSGILNNDSRSVKKEEEPQKEIEKIKKLAPQTVAQLETKSNFVTDNDGVYEKVGENQLRNVDTDEVFTPQDINSYSEWQHNPKELRKPFEFKYNPNLKSTENANNYVLSKPDVVEAYNNYIKNPTIENREKYEDISGKYFEKYGEIESQFKKADKTTQLAPKTVAQIQESNQKDTQNNSTNHIEQTGNMVNSVAKNEQKTEAEFNPKEYIKNISNSKEYGEISKQQMSELKRYRQDIKKSIDDLKQPKLEIETIKGSHSGHFYTKIVKNLNNELIFADREFNNIINEIKKFANLKTLSIPNEKIDELENRLLKAVVDIEGNEEDTVKKYQNFYEALSRVYDYHRCTEVISNTKVKGNKNGNESGIAKSIKRNIQQQSTKISDDNRRNFEYPDKNTNNLRDDENNAFNSRSSSIANEQIRRESVRNSETLETVKNKSYNINKGVDSDESATTDARRRAISEENEGTEGRNRTREEEQSRVGEILPRNGQQELRQYGLPERRIAPKDEETINASYKNQNELNKAIEKFINDEEYKKYQSSAEIPAEIKEWLKKYAGAGGLEKQGAEGKGLLSEYYTPQNIVNKMWDLTKQYVETDGAKVLEPSVGIGRFLENAPKNTSFDVVEMNPVSAEITKILYPDANVTTGEFQERFINKENNTPVKKVNPEYDIVIGNPPYGQYSGKYKGMGEGKKFSRLEAYFINRGLDSLKENGVMTFIVPSSFLDGAITTGKQEIGSKSELLDAYRLPENTFDTTSIGTDIIVLRKTGLKSADKNLYLGEWFKEHPEKILGNVEERKNRFGKTENYVKGDKNAVDNIDTSGKDIKETVPKQKTTSSKTTVKKSNNITGTDKKVKKPSETIKGNIEYTEYKPENSVSERERELWNNTQVDGSLKGNYKPGADINLYKGKLYNDFNYLQGDIYSKLEQLEKEDISPEQKEIQRKKLENVKPKPKTAAEIKFNPTSDFIQEFELDKAEEPSWGNKKLSPLIQGFIDYIEQIPSADWRDDFSSSNIRAFIKGDKVKFNISFDSKTPEYRREKSKKMSKLKSMVEKYFSNYVDKVLDKETKERLVNEWNRNFNNIYNPDYLNMPFMVKGLNSKFKGNDLKLKKTQIEGINFLTNQGVGLLGFEVGVGKTLTGIISTVQNMQMGRCKRPLIIIPKNIKKNWKEEFAETFPNIKVVDVDNMSKWDGNVEDGTVTLATYQALDNIWYNKTDEELTNMIFDIGNNFDKEVTKRGKENVKERFGKMIGKAIKGNKAKFKFEDLGFDHVTFDEAHIGKNLFDEARADSGETTADGKAKGNNSYFNMKGGRQSKTALRMFLLTQNILNSNNNRNVFMLTATPFNNQSLEVFNMLSYIAKDKLDKMGLYNVYQFNEQFIDVTSDIVLDSNNNPVEKQVELGFKNVDVLRNLIKNVMLIRTAEDAEVIRPNKVVKRPKLDATDEQIYWFNQADEIAMNKGEDGALFKSISMRRNATISPDVAANNFDVSPEDFIKNSPKLNYIMNCIESMKKNDPKTSQLIYMPIGVKFLNKIKQYLVDKGVYKSNEIEIISGENALSNPDKEEARISKITDSFNDKEGDVKLIIGTQKIQVGMNLNKNTSTLYIPYVEWNPTDYVQTVGRMWRQGNRYDDIRVVVPLLKNSSDSFMFQKLDEKIKRMNDLMGSDKDYISNDDLQTEEEKIAMITNPEKRAKMYVLLQKDKIEFEIKKLETREKIAQKYKNNLQEAKNNVEYYESEIKKLEDKKQAEGELSPYWTEKLKSYKKSLYYQKKSIDSINAQIELNNIEFDGKDSPEAINDKIEKFKQDIEKLNEIEEQKAAEYSAEYDEERKNIKPISEHIKDFEKDTIDLYGEKNPKYEESKPLTTDKPKSYEKTREAAYGTPVIKLETKAQRTKKSKTKERIEKAKQIVDARKYNKIIKEGIQKWNSEINIRRYETDRILNNFINITKSLAKEIGVNDKNLREIMPFLRERTGLPSELNRPELKKVWDKVQNSKGMADRLTKLADTASEKFEKFWEEYKAVQASGEDIEDKSGVDNYIFHDWKKDESGNFPLLTHAFLTKSKHAKQRTIPTYYEGIQGIEQENGEIKKYTPANLDYAVLLKKAADNLIKATMDKAFADSVKNLQTSEGANLVLPASQAPSNWVEINHGALNKTVARPVSTSFGEKVAPDLQNKLAELGIAIGRRLPKYKGNGSLNSLGRYVKNEPPEIRLQRWFSNKTLAHEVGHALDDLLGLQKSGFVNRHKNELTELNRERIDAFAKQGDKKYATKDSELIAELFGVIFNDVETAYKIAPGATNEVMEKMAKGNMASLLPENYDWTDAKHVLEEKIVEFFKMPVRVHPDIATTLKTVFEPKKEYLDIFGFKPGKFMDEQTAIMKMIEFSLSGFHNIALTESYLGNVGVGGLKEALNIKKIFNSIKNNKYDVYENNKAAEQAIRDGLQLGTPLDIDRGTVETLINNVGNWAETHIKGLGKSLSMAANIAGKGIELNNKALWDVIHNNYKLSTYELFINNETKRKGRPLTAAERKEIAFWVNDSFGGQVMEALGISPSSKKALSRWLMSPDWLISTTRQFMGMFASETGHKKINKLAENSRTWQKIKEISQALGINSITDDVTATGMRGRNARAFWIRAAILSALYMNILNAVFRMRDKKEHPELYPGALSAKDYSMLGNSLGAKLYVFIGRNKDGTERYLRLGKQFREIPEMAADPIKHFGAKLSPAIQSGLVAATGRSVGGFENKEISEAKGWKRVGLAAKNLGSKYVPLSVQNAYNKTVKKQGSDFTPFDLIGNTSKGMSKYKAKEQFKEAFLHGNKPGKIEEIEKSMMRNGFSKKDIKTIEKTAKTSYTKQFKDGYKEALSSGDMVKVKKVTDTMTKKNISPADQRQIYTKALSEYYKEKGLK